MKKAVKTFFALAAISWHSARAQILEAAESMATLDQILEAVELKTVFLI